MKILTVVCSLHFFKCFKKQDNFVRSRMYFYVNEKKNNNKNENKKHFWRKQVILFRENIFRIIFKI